MNYIYHVESGNEQNVSEGRQDKYKNGDVPRRDRGTLFTLLEASNGGQLLMHHRYGAKNNAKVVSNNPGMIMIFYVVLSVVFRGGNFPNPIRNCPPGSDIVGMGMLIGK